MRRLHITPNVVTDELLPEAKSTAVQLTRRSTHAEITDDHFDEYDNWAPGNYSWIEVDDHVADAWDAGLDACDAAGLDPHSRAGMDLRWRALHGDTPMSDRLADWIQRRESRLATEEQTRREHEEAVSRYEAALAGYVNLGPHPRCSGAVPDEVIHSGPNRYGARSELVRVDDHTIVERLRMSANLWTRDPEVIAAAQARRSITGYLYSLPLAETLAELERTLPPGRPSWLGGTYRLDEFQRTGWQRTSSGPRSSTDLEKLARLRAYLAERAEWDATNGALIQRAMDLAVDGSITATHWSPNDVVGIPEIADKLNVKRATVDVWRQRDNGFPAPTLTVGGRPAWKWATVASWAHHTGRLPESAR